MRPRLPLCLLPFVGAAAFLASFSTSDARSYTIENFLAENSVGNWDQLYAYGFNISNNRDGVSNNNALQDFDNTFTFRVNDYDGTRHDHDGGASYMAYRDPIVLSAKGGNNATAGNYGNTIYLGNGTLTIGSQWSASLPIDPGFGHGATGVPGGSWTYVSQMGFKSLDKVANTNVVVDFSNNQSAGNQTLVFTSKGPNQDLVLNSTVVADANGDYVPLQILKASPPSAIQADSDAPPANFDISGSLTVNGSNTNLVYADADGYFKVGLSESHSVNVTSGAFLTFKNAIYVDVTATTNVTSGGSLIVEGADTLNSGGYQGGGAGGNTQRGVMFNTVNVSEKGSFSMWLDGVMVRKNLNVIDGGMARFLGSDFQVSGTTTLSGYTDNGYTKSQLYVGADSRNGVFGGKVTVGSFATLRVEGKDVTFKNGLEVKDNGIFRLGGQAIREEFTSDGSSAPVLSAGETHRGLIYINGILIPESNTPFDYEASKNNLTINNGMVFGKNARIEVNVLNQTYLNGVLNNFEFENDVYFALVKPTESVTIVENGEISVEDERVPFAGNAAYFGGINLKNNATVTLTYSATSDGDAIDTSKDGDYEFAGNITGQGNINLQAYSSKHAYVLSGDSTYTGNTYITLGILEVSTENYVNGKVVSGGLGGPNGKVVFANRPEWNAIPGFALSPYYNGTTNWVDQAELHRDFVIGSQQGTARGMIIAGDYNIVNETGTGEVNGNFAANVVIHGNISQGSGSVGHLVKAGSGRLTVDGKMTYTGGTYIDNGTFVLLRDGDLTKDSTIAFNQKAVIFGQSGITNVIPTLEMSSGMTKLDNNIQMTMYGRIDATQIPRQVNLNGLIYIPESDTIINSYLELFTDSATGSMKLNGGVNVGESTIAFYGKQLVLASQVYGTETIFDLSGKTATTAHAYGRYYSPVFDQAYDRADLAFDTTKANQTAGDGSKYYTFGAQIQGANNIIKTGKNTLVLNSNLDNGTSYKGSTIVDDGRLVMGEDGKISSTSFLRINRNVASGTHGIFSVNGTEQSVAKLLGNGTADLTQGVLIVKGAHATGESFDGTFSGNGVLSIESVFNFAGLLKSDPNRLPNDQFTGVYYVADTGTLNTLVGDVLSPKATLLMGGDNSKVNITNTVQNIGRLESEFSKATINFGTTGVPDGTGLIVGMPYNDEEEGVPTGNGLYKGSITGDGFLTKQGSGTLILNGLDGSTLNYTGDTKVSEGRLHLDGVNIVNSLVNVEDRGYLYVDVNNGDTSIGEIYLSGTLETNGIDHKFRVNHMTLDGATMKLTAEITGHVVDDSDPTNIKEYNTAKCSSIIIDGIVDFAPMSEKNHFDLDLRPGNWGRTGGTLLELFRANLTQIDDIDNYFSVTNDYVFLNLEMSKEGFSASDTMVTVQVDRNKKVTFEKITGHGFANILDGIDQEYGSTGTIGGQSNSMLTSIMDRFYVMRNVDDVLKATESLSGASTYVLATAELEEFRRHVNLVRNRASMIGLRAPDKILKDEEYNVWGMGIGSQSSLSSNGAVPGYDKDTWGAMIGFDMPVSSELAWGMSFSYTKSDISIKNSDSATLDTYYIDGFARYQQDNWSYLGIATLGMGSGDTERHVTVSDFNGTGRGSSDSFMLSAYGEVGYDILLQNNWMIQPFGNIALGNYHSGGYSETGLGDAGLDVESLNHFVTRIGAGARGIYSFEADAHGQIGRVELRALVTQDLTDVSPDVSRRFINSASATSDAQGSGMGKTAFEIGAGVQVPVAHNVSVFADISGEFRSEQSSVYGNIGVRVTF